ncbi:MAG TPA: gamma carbonic anhydrase family protein [Polyangiaceae bacterium]|nr:gamma carbonic anhydrase family protein [Polyangiaceae bacterium]
MPALIAKFEESSPRFGSGVLLAENAVVIGDVELAEDVSVWFGAVLRGDVGRIRVGARTNIQDLAMVHMTTALSNAEIAEDVTIGHAALVHGARIEPGVLVGMGAILLDNAVIGAESIVGAGALVTSDFRAPPRSLILGRPAKVVRELSEEQYRQGRLSALHYVALARRHCASSGALQPPPTK